MRARRNHRQFVLGRVGLRVRLLHLQLIEKPLLAFPSARQDRLQREPRALRSASAPPVRRGSTHARRRDWKGANRTYRSRPKRIMTASICMPKPSTCRGRTPGFLRHSPVDALEADSPVAPSRSSPSRRPLRATETDLARAVWRTNTSPGQHKIEKRPVSSLSSTRVRPVF